ncbi:hypothetical protein PS918_02716 [Pseudomonas fluorescens]|uniref:YCII-related domain-containing protein n=1 Tax=Pseudomonas fluorescens TaxID=294 RepID=A0A5E7SEV4_PSEFL|nr:YciI family protein [Pseudomonas fluorescens]VVP85311.1 hypothetical protein PS918_02716 [Pseudomonas fluorescens]
MNEYILLMHQDAPNSEAANDPSHWARYIAQLRGTGRFDGGSSIGQGERLRKGQLSQPSVTDISGFIRVRAGNLEEAKKLLAGNPVYEAGGTVEIRELPST